MTLYIDQKERSANIVGLGLMDEFCSGIKNFPFDKNKFNEDYTDLAGKQTQKEFVSRKALKVFTDYEKPQFNLKKKKKNPKAILERANKMSATVWQVEDEEEAKEGLRNVLKNLPYELTSEALDMDYLKKLTDKEITNRVDLRRMHNLYRNFLWYS